ncbi:DUF6101 family protein [Microbaculum marinum]|uniref:DUF6101 family protein n=1 Tax=Microbaculum marinum TaxID=1764581 RepID=A0AAW9RL78_9HYPH
MRRQTTDIARMSEGESCLLRLDPFQLPARVTFHGWSRAGGVPQTAVVGRDGVMIRRETNAGAPLYVTVPIGSYRGVLLSVRDRRGTVRVGLRLHHANCELGVPLFEADDTDDVIAEWQAWGRALARPLLIETALGEIYEPDARIGAVAVKPPRARRANRFFEERRPRFLCGRKMGGALPGIVHREDEIIARTPSD